jgi:hypothetical protein
MPIRSPVLFFFHGDLIVGDLDELRRLGERFEDGQTYISRETLTADVPGWLLSRDGQFFELTPGSRRRESLRPLRWLWNFVRVCYAVSAPRSITVGELTERIRGLRDRFPDAPITSDLRGFLATRDPAEVIDAQTLTDWNIGD